MTEIKNFSLDGSNEEAVKELRQLIKDLEREENEKAHRLTEQKYNYKKESEDYYAKINKAASNNP